MATHKSAEKRARQTIKKNELNRAARSKVRKLAKDVETAVAKKDKAIAKKTAVVAEAALAKAAGKGVLHPNTAARKASRLAKRVNAMA